MISFIRYAVIAVGIIWFPLVASPTQADVDDDHQIGFIWDPPSNADSTVAYYRIYLSVDGGDYHLVGTTTNNYFVVPGDSGSFYRLRVTGVNAHEEEGPVSPESNEVLCLPEESTPVAFRFVSAEVQENQGGLKLVWETDGHLEPSSFRVHRWDPQRGEESLLSREIVEETSEDQVYRYWCVDRDVMVGETYRYTIQATDPSGVGFLAISLNGEVRGPRTYRLLQNYPNPFNAETTLSYQIPEAGRVVLAIFNTRGQKVRTLVDAVESPDLHVVYWDGTDQTGLPVASGMYFCRMWSGDFVDVKKMTVIR